MKLATVLLVECSADVVAVIMGCCYLDFSCCSYLCCVVFVFSSSLMFLFVCDYLELLYKSGLMVLWMSLCSSVNLSFQTLWLPMRSLTRRWLTCPGYSLPNLFWYGWINKYPIIFLQLILSLVTVFSFWRNKSHFIFLQIIRTLCNVSCFWRNKSPVIFFFRWSNLLPLYHSRIMRAPVTYN